MKRVTVNEPKIPPGETQGTQGAVKKTKQPKLDMYFKKKDNMPSQPPGSGSASRNERQGVDSVENTSSCSISLPAPDIPQPSRSHKSLEIPMDRTVESGNLRLSDSSDSLSNARSVDREPLSAMDIGLWVGMSKTDKDKVDILQNSWRPGDTYQLPHTERGGKKRFLRQSHLDNFAWLAYSHVKSGLFCKVCTVFEQRDGGKSKQGLKSLVTEPLRRFDRLTGNDGYLVQHSQTSYHQTNAVRADNFLERMKDPTTNIHAALDEQHKEEVSLNRKGLEGIIHCIVYLGRQGLSLRGHRDDGNIQGSEREGNEGNFRELLRFAVRRGDTALEKHLKNAKKNATYTSKTTQNDIIACIDEHISNVISERISKSKFFSVIADETTDNNRKEQLSVSVRYLDEGKVREDFLGFVEIDDLSGKGIAEKIVNELMRHNIDLFYMIGQGYDGASAMSGGIKGCQAIIREKYPAAVYIHCAAHCLNLVISKSSQVPAIRNCWNDINEIVNFFHFSPQRIKCMENIIQKDEMEPSSQLLQLHKFSDTRWVERHDALIVFKRLLPYVIEALTDIASWKNDGNARSLLKKIDFEFIVSLSVLSAILTETRPLSQQLQAVSTDMLECSTQIKSVHEKVQSLRENDVFDAVYQDAIKLGLEINVNESVPRLANRQSHRSNHPSSTPSEYYRRAVFIPFWILFSASLRNAFQITMQLLAQCVP
ncbi:52 kDa repressor of the inhibitor of the protein kinase-like [Macrobrachium rosenbergii]|uniref:52 kDa repressor of the inhibitor of the protein kinase-like n=1 Tax=Macrobrachium rosenbergii TaxID=79674 RepID=UPI0034D6019A